MVKLFPVVGTLLSIVSLVLLAVGAATNKWVVMDKTNTELNPTTVNSKLGIQDKQVGVTSSTSDITYSVSHYGLWIGCHVEHKGAVSCSYIGSRCFSNVCWIRKTSRSRTKTCLDTRVSSVPNCTAYQVIRAFVTLGALAMICGVATQLVSLLTVNRSLAMLAGLIIFLAGLFVMVAFAIFYSEEVAKSGLRGVGHIGYSLKLITAAWPLMLLCGLLSCFAASMGLRHKEISDYSASNY
ncbi:unnamed protein product [Chondrus crispus]|uniref:Claudin n=1 Tax=Chondrus crispus TaxID=2769 RepID=R7QDP2_CHOCR|nr:unnamed protein product [Chondrus crispus]CDF36209.1 unnamed protein product [Chondrus crispus]|eukprot:XP_005716028.1 unnamed protein product [Chondrus crispus]